jgi:DNA-binding NarL/FixJ family response regulator
MKPIRIVLADAQYLFCYSLFDCLNSMPETEVVAASGTGQEAIHLVRQYQPDIVLSDVQLPDMHSSTLIKRISQSNPATGILVLARHDKDRRIWPALQAGVKGYLVKGCSRPQLLAAINAVAQGQIVFGAKIAAYVANRVAPLSLAGPANAPGLQVSLTKREWEIFALMGQGLSNSEIAEQLFLSPKTVRNYTSRIFDKLHVDNRAQAIITFQQIKK